MRNTLYMIMILGILAVLAGANCAVHKRLNMECVICRTNAREDTYFYVHREWQTNTSVLESYLNQKKLLHGHIFVNTAHVGYNIIGKPCQTANFKRSPLFGLEPENELRFLTNRFSDLELLRFCQSLTNSTSAYNLREIIRNWETNR